MAPLEQNEVFQKNRFVHLKMQNVWYNTGMENPKEKSIFTVSDVDAHDAAVMAGMSLGDWIKLMEQQYETVVITTPLLDGKVAVCYHTRYGRMS